MLYDPNLSKVEDLQLILDIKLQARDHYERDTVERIRFNGIGDYSESAVWKMAEINAMACAQNEGWKRPSMDEVCK